MYFEQHLNPYNSASILALLMFSIELHILSICHIHLHSHILCIFASFKNLNYTLFPTFRIKKKAFVNNFISYVMSEKTCIILNIIYWLLFNIINVDSGNLTGIFVVCPMEVEVQFQPSKWEIVYILNRKFCQQISNKWFMMTA